MTAHTIKHATRAALAARMRASWRIDVWPTVVGGLVALATILAIPYLVVFGLSRSDGMAEMTVWNPAEATAGVVLVLVIIMNSESGTQRRETLLGGWTRREQLAVVAINGAVGAIVAGLAWLIVASFREGLAGWSQEIAAGGNVTLSFVAPEPTLLAALIVALCVFLAAFVPVFFSVLWRVHWAASLVGGSLVVIIVQQVLFIAYLATAYREPEIYRAFTGVPPVAVLVAIVVGALFVLLSWRLAVRSPIRRYTA